MPNVDADSAHNRKHQRYQEANMTRDELNRELRMHSATWQSVAVVYGAIVATLVFSALSIIA